MSERNARLRPGDYVEVKSPAEILKTLDAKRAIDHVPFMPEMIEYCGRRFKITRRVVTTCLTGAASPRSLFRNDVFTLEGLRCSGAAHDGCQKACMIFWREAWLRKVEGPVAKSGVNPESKVDTAGLERLRTGLEVSCGPNTYYCQASELVKATYHLSTRPQKVVSYWREVQAGNFTLRQMARVLWIWLGTRVHWAFKGLFAQGTSKSTPVESLNLQPGEWVEVKSMQEILETLNEKAMNRGLMFTADMKLACGTRQQVKRRLDKIISDGTGEMRQLRNTVCLEGTFCGCAYLGLGRGGCSRAEYAYWREIWLRRSN